LFKKKKKPQSGPDHRLLYNSLAWHTEVFAILFTSTSLNI